MVNVLIGFSFDRSAVVTFITRVRATSKSILQGVRRIFVAGLAAPQLSETRFPDPHTAIFCRSTFDADADLPSREGGTILEVAIIFSRSRR
jgi:hypothetical protein